MRIFPSLLLTAAAFARLAFPQALTQSTIQNPKPDSWPTFNGDYSGRRYSPLKEINTTNVKDLRLEWSARIGSDAPPTFTGGPGADLPAGGGQVAPRGTPLLVDGVLYAVVPNAVYAVDAHDGHEIWHYVWKGLPAFQLGNRGAGIYGNWL